MLSEVQGTLKMRTYLSGMPECKLGLNDKVLFEAQGRGGRQKAVDLEDVKFHQCVRLARFDNDRTIAFIPPDGAVSLVFLFCGCSWPAVRLVFVESVGLLKVGWRRAPNHTRPPHKTPLLP